MVFKDLLTHQGDLRGNSKVEEHLFQCTNQSHQKQNIEEKVQQGELTLGEEVVASEYIRYKLDSDTNTVVEEREVVC